MIKIGKASHWLCRLCCGLAAATIFASCLKDQDDYFDRSASERMQDVMTLVKQTLRSSPYGWEFDYYPGGNLAYGGVVYTVRFDSLTATVGCSLLPDSTETTYYRITNDNGPVLTFDTYNRLMHYFSTPSSSEYEAKGGEFEFVVTEVTDDLITLYGKKTRNTMYLRRLTAPADDYATQTVAVFDNIPQGFSGTLGTSQVEGFISLVNKRLTLVAGSDSVSMPFAFNRQGLRLYQPVSIGGLSVQSLCYDAESGVFTSDDQGCEGLSLQGIPYADDVVRYGDYEGNYTLRYDGTRTATVALEPNRLDGTYRLTGLSSHYELVLNYDYATGCLRLAPQILGEYNGATVYFLSFSSSSGRVWLAEEASFTLRWNGNKNRVAYNFSTTNPDLYACDSAVLYLISFDAEGNTVASTVTASDWTVNGSALLYNLGSLQKQRK